MVQFPALLFEESADVISLRHFEGAREYIAFGFTWFWRVPDTPIAIRFVVVPAALVNEPVILDLSAMPPPEAVPPPALIDGTRLFLHENAIAMGEEGDLRKLPRVHTIHELYFNFE